MAIIGFKRAQIDEKSCLLRRWVSLFIFFGSVKRDTSGRDWKLERCKQLSSGCILFPACWKDGKHSSSNVKAIRHWMALFVSLAHKHICH
jgi:hypothetical protein